MDLDNNTVASDGEKLTKLPKEAVDELLNCITEYTFPELKNIDKICPILTPNGSPAGNGNGNANGNGQGNLFSESEEERKKNEYYLRMSFVSFFVSLFGNLHTFINEDLEDTEDVFDADNYIAQQVTDSQVILSPPPPLSLFSRPFFPLQSFPLPSFPLLPVFFLSPFSLAFLFSSLFLLSISLPLLPFSFPLITPLFQLLSLPSPSCPLLPLCFCHHLAIAPNMYFHE